MRPRQQRGAQAPQRKLPRHATAPGKLRIIGGQWKRTPLPVADAPGLRPTPERLRETLFNWLGADMRGWRCMDVFAGTGALGFEAASRGASWVLLCEQDRAVAALLQKNLQLLLGRAAAHVPDLQVQCTDGVRALQMQRNLDVIFLDPPFAQEALYASALAQVPAALAPEGLVYLESQRAWSAQDAAAYGLQLLRHTRAGQVHGHLFTRLAEA